MKIVFKPLHDGVIIPKKSYINDAGHDVFMQSDVDVVPGENTIPMGFKIILPPGIKAKLKPRSSWMGKLMGGDAPIDPSYSGEWNLRFYNATNETYHVKKGERIAQIEFEFIPDVELVEESFYTSNSRGEGGLGSTGK